MKMNDQPNDTANDAADALSKQGTALLQSQRFEEALASYDQALSLQPNHVPTIFNHGTALANLQRFDEALTSYEYALSIQPNHAQTLSNLGSVLVHLNHFHAALARYDQALKSQANHVEALSNRGGVLIKLNRFEEAAASFAQALKINPEYAEAHWNEGLCRLSTGDFALGWQKHEWRWKAKAFMPMQRNFAQPLWLGKESLHNKTILLHAEQGLGDTIQFCRYAHKVAALGATVILEVQPTLKTLLRDVAGVSHILARGETLPAFDFHCPLLSLPLAFGTDLDSIPFAKELAKKNSLIDNILLRCKRLIGAPKSQQTPYYIQPDALHKAKWKNKLSHTTLPRIGLAWSGNSIHKDDKNRSIPLSDFLPLINKQSQTALPMQFHCLQKELRPSDQALLTQLNQQNKIDIAFIGNELKDFSDTAALVDLMDLVITVDTSIAHLAGAMGKPVWILLPFNPDWRWLTDRNDSPWYPSARLFRQKEMGDWSGVMRDVQRELLEFNATNHAGENTKTAQSR